MLFGFLRGLPGLGRGTRISSRTGTNRERSARRPGVTVSYNGRRRLSTLGCESVADSEAADLTERRRVGVDRVEAHPPQDYHRSRRQPRP